MANGFTQPIIPNPFHHTFLDVCTTPHFYFSFSSLSILIIKTSPRVSWLSHSLPPHNFGQTLTYYAAPNTHHSLLSTLGTFFYMVQSFWNKSHIHSHRDSKSWFHWLGYLSALCFRHTWTKDPVVIVNCWKHRDKVPTISYADNE